MEQPDSKPKIGEINLLKLPMVRPSTTLMYESSRNPRNEKFVLDLKFNDMVELLISFCEHRVEFGGLGNCTRESV